MKYALIVLAALTLSGSAGAQDASRYELRVTPRRSADDLQVEILRMQQRQQLQDERRHQHRQHDEHVIQQEDYEAEELDSDDHSPTER